MLRLRFNTLQKCFKNIIQRTKCSTPTSSSLQFLSLLLTNGCYKGVVRNSNSVIWKRYQAMTAVLLDNSCNKNPIIFEQFKERVFDLGHKTYDYYRNRLKELDANLKNDFIVWQICFWPTVYDFSTILCSDGKVRIRQFCSLQQTKVQSDHIHTDENDSLHCKQNQQHSPFDAKNPFMALLTVNRELHKGGDRSCMHIELSIEGSNMLYDAGDHVAMYPINDKNLVERLGKLCQADLDIVFSWHTPNNSQKHLLPCPTTYRNALTHYLEITALPTIQILKELTEYCTSEADKEFLSSMTSDTPEGKKKYQSWIQDCCRNIVHILEDIKSCKPPIDHICQLLPRLQPRYYSISSSSKLHPTKVHITAVLVKYKTLTGRINKGVATTFLKEKQTASGQVKVPIFISKSQFHLPNKPEVPIIMVGPGTGLAPFRGFIQERQFLRDEGKVVGDTILYFGCRRKHEDFIYKEELEEYVAKGTLTLRTAFSRDQEKKMYVTHLIEQDADLLWKVIDENEGHIYICGDARNIAVDVRNILVKIVSIKGKMDKDGAVQYLKKMEAEKRYVADVWS